MNNPGASPTRTAVRLPVKHRIAVFTGVMFLLLVGYFGTGSPPLLHAEFLQVGQTPTEALFSLAVERNTVPPDANWYEEAADLYRDLGDEAAALAHLSAAADLSTNPALWHAAAAAFIERADWTAAGQALNAALALAPEDPLAHYWLGIIAAPYNPRQAYRHLNFVTADPVLGEDARQLQETIATVETSNPAYQSAEIGIALVGLAHWLQAEQSFAMAVVFAPDYAEAWAYLGLARAQQAKDFSGAFERAETFAPQNALVDYLHGLAWRAAGDFTQSRLALAEAQQLAPQNPAFAAELGAAYQYEGNYPLAEQWFQQAALLDPENVELLNLQALFYADTLYNLSGNGLTIIQEAAASQPTNATLQAAHAWALFNLGEVAAAEAAIDEAVRLEPDNPRALYDFALIAQSQGRQDEAIDALLQLVNHANAQGFDVLARSALQNLGYRP